MVRRIGSAALGALAILGCGGSEDAPDPVPPTPFTEAAARDALRGFMQTSDPEGFCGYLWSYAERQVLGVLREKYDIRSPDCESAVAEVTRRAAPAGIDERELDRFTDGRITGDERETLRRDVQLDREEHSASFLNEYRIGTVMRLVDGRWLVAGFATGG